MIIDKVLVIASAFIKNKQGKVLLLQRSEKSSYPGYWQLVEGKLEEGETPVETIRRETKEELGVEIVQAEFNNVFYNEIEAKGSKYLCFRAVFNADVSSNKVITSDEHTTFGWFGKEDVVNLPLLPGTGNILDKLLG